MFEVQYCWNNIFEEITSRTSHKSNHLKSFEGCYPKKDIWLNWKKMVNVLETEETVEMYALKLLYKLSQNDLKISDKLIFKILTVCLILSQKVSVDQYHSIEAFSLVSRIPIRELINLEIQILMLLDYKLIVKEQELGSNFTEKGEKSPS